MCCVYLAVFNSASGKLGSQSLVPVLPSSERIPDLNFEPDRD